MATFKRNNAGEWVVMGTPAEVQVGKVKVLKKSGRTSTVVVASVGAPFKGYNGETMVYGYIAEKAAKTPKVTGWEAFNAPVEYNAPDEPVNEEFAY